MARRPTKFVPDGTVKGKIQKIYRTVPGRGELLDADQIKALDQRAGSRFGAESSQPVLKFDEQGRPIGYWSPKAGER